MYYYIVFTFMKIYAVQVVFLIYLQYMFLFYIFFPNRPLLVTRSYHLHLLDQWIYISTPTLHLLLLPGLIVLLVHLKLYQELL